MKRFLLDTNITSEMTRPHPDQRVFRWLDEVDDDSLYMSVLSLAEILRGVHRLPVSKRRTALEEWLNGTLRPWFQGRILPVDQATAERLGVLAAERDKKGRPFPFSDGLIAATALEHDLILVTRNVKDFQGLGVAIFNPWEDQP